MIQSASPPPDENPQTENNSGSLGKSQIEEALNRAIVTGAEALPQQLRYLLAIGQLNGTSSEDIPYTPRSLSIAQARLNALEPLSSLLTEKQIKQLLKDIKRIEDIDVRIALLSRMAIYVAPDDFYETVKEIWQQVDYIDDIVVRTQSIYKIAPLLTLVHDEPATSTPLLNILRLAESMDNPEARLRSLIAVAPHLPYELSLRTFNRVLNELEHTNNDSICMRTLVAMSADIPDTLVSQALNLAVKIENPSERARVLTALAQSMPLELRPRMRQDALDAINTIESEEDRAESLIAFAPHLDYASTNDKFPAILAKALTIAVGISRRHIRARVLVAIAPHLTTDLQGEALAAVHSLDNEQDRAMLLAELAPNLPPNMLVASLAVAHTMITQDARVHALTALAHYVPESARPQTIRDALAAASNLPHYLERVTAIIDLIDLLPDDLIEQALSNALESTRSIENENAKSRALNHIGMYLPSSLLHQALDVSMEIGNPNQRMNAIIGIMPSLIDDERKQQAQQALLECTEEIRLEFKRARALVTIIPHLSHEMYQQVVETADGFADAFNRVSVYLAIAQNSPPEERPTLIAKAWTRLPFIEDGYDRASMIAALAPFLPDRAKNDLSKAVETAIDLIEDGYDKASAIRILTPLLADIHGSNTYIPPDMTTALAKGIETALLIPNQVLRSEYLMEGVNIWVNNVHDDKQSYELWQTIVAQLKVMPLADVLICLASSIPLIKEMSDQDTLLKIADVLGIR